MRRINKKIIQQYDDKTRDRYYKTMLATAHYLKYTYNRDLSNSEIRIYVYIRNAIAAILVETGVFTAKQLSEYNPVFKLCFTYRSIQRVNDVKEIYKKYKVRDPLYDIYIEIKTQFEAFLGYRPLHEVCLNCQYRDTLIELTKFN